jgi:hypothetical protein
MLLFIVQTRLVAANNVRTHMRLGLAGIALAAVIVVIGVLTTLAAMVDARPRPLGLTGEQFSIFPFTAIALFAGFFSAAIATRRRPALHKRFMMLSMISILGPAVARVLRMFSAQDYFAITQVAVAAAFVVWCLAYDRLKHGIYHPVYVVGGAAIILSWPLRGWIASTETWTRFAHSLIS